MDLLRHYHLLGFVQDVARTSVWLLLLSLVFLPLEALFGVHPRKILSRGVLGDIGFYFVAGLAPGLILSPILAVFAVAGRACVPWTAQAEIASWPIWARAVAALFVSEFGFYWAHRWTHEVPLLWRFHAVHHKPERVYHLISSRAHPLDNVFVRLFGFVPVTMLGLATPLTAAGGAVSALVVIFLTLWGFFIHANIRWRLGPLEWLIATPAFHHWHHTLEPRDRNFASTLPLMDLLFGTFHLPRQFPTTYGTETAMPVGVVGQLVHPFVGESVAPAPETRLAERAA